MIVMRNPTAESECVKTRQRLLEAAGAVFAEHGFKNATVREICKHAEANVAAINYHFGDKQALYSETLRYWIRESLAKYPPNMGIDEHATPQQKLHAYVRSFFWRIFDEGRPSWYGKLIARDDRTDTRAGRLREGNDAADLSTPPRHHPRTHSQRDRRTASPNAPSVMGQIVFYHHCRPAIDKIYPDVCYSREEIDRLAAHVTKFSLAALASINEETKKDTQVPS